MRRLREGSLRFPGLSLVLDPPRFLGGRALLPTRPAIPVKSRARPIGMRDESRAPGPGACPQSQSRIVLELVLEPPAGSPAVPKRISRACPQPDLHSRVVLVLVLALGPQRTCPQFDRARGIGVRDESRAPGPRSLSPWRRLRITPTNGSLCPCRFVMKPRPSFSPSPCGRVAPFLPG